MPERSASSAASASAAVVVPTISWLHALASDPAPSGPSRRTVLPIALKSGRSRRKSSSLAPAMMARVPSTAPFVPPLTGRIDDDGVAAARLRDPRPEFLHRGRARRCS